MALFLNSYPLTPDPYFASVQYLLMCNEANGSTTIVDASSASRTTTCRGNAAASTAQFKFGTSAIALDGTGDWIDIPDAASLEPGSADLTLEGWFRRSSGGDYFSKNTPLASDGILLQADKLYVSSTGAGWDMIDNQDIGTIPAGAWTHLAITRIGNTWRGFVDGVKGLEVTAAGTVHNNNQRWSFGNQNDGSGSGITGHIGAIRLTFGVGRYAADFEVPFEAFPTFGP